MLLIITKKTNTVLIFDLLPLLPISPNSYNQPYSNNDAAFWNQNLQSLNQYLNDH